MDNKLLNIVIPTYNRPEAIKKQVALLLPQLTSEVSLTVFDNHSDIPVSKLFAEQDLCRFTVIRNTVNIGGDANIARCLESVSTGWAWPLGDDDPVKDNAVETVLNHIKTYGKYCYINFGNVRQADIRSFNDLNNFLGEYGTLGRAFFISHCLFNMTILHNYLFFYYKFLSSQIGQLGFVVKYFEDNPLANALFKQDYLVNYNTVAVTWNPMNLIVNSSIIIDQFRNSKIKYQSGLFKGLCNMYLGYLSHYECSLKEKFYYHNYIKSKLGICNMLKFSLIVYVGFLIQFVLPKSLYKMLKEYGIAKLKK